MTIEIWSPVICREPACFIQVDSSGNGNMNYVSTISRCVDHNLFDGQPLVNMLRREDAVYSSGMHWLASSFPTKFISGNWAQLASGVTLIQLVSGVPPSALSTRVVHISGTGFAPSALAIANLQTAINSDLGSGVVLVSGSIT